MFPKIRLKIRDFFKKYKKLIIIILVVWVIVILINYLLGHMPKSTNFELITTYEPHTALMDKSEVPKKLQGPIEELIKEFMDACNNKDFEKAYSLLSEDCKKDVFPQIEYLEDYIEVIFNEKKIYNIQNFSNKDNYYIYTVTILNDIMASGLTDEELDTYEETFVIKEEKGNLKLSIRGYIANNKIDVMYEDEYIKINIENVKVDYETVTYIAKIRNKTDNYIVLDNSTEKYEIVLNTDMGYRNLHGFYIEPVVLEPDVTKNFELTFGRYYDETGNINSLIFNDIRVLKSYTGLPSTREDELKNAVKRYSFELDL